MLATRLGCTVEELLEKITSDELTEWFALMDIEAEEQENRPAPQKRRF